jgi:pimeloyl-ACP methyl ester carboxylesterase
VAGAGRRLSRRHTVFAPTLDGVSERARPGGEFITIADHATEVVQWLREHDLHDSVLVGHSYAGNVISVVADRLKASALHGIGADRTLVKHYVFLDAIVPLPSAKEWRWCDSHSDELKTARLAAIREHGGFLPAPAATAFGLMRQADEDMLERLLTPMPGACYTEPVQFRFGGTRGLSRSYIAATAPPYASLRTVQERVRSEPGWAYREIACGHDAMLDLPEELAELLLALTA